MSCTMGRFSGQLYNQSLYAEQLKDEWYDQRLYDEQGHDQPVYGEQP